MNSALKNAEAQESCSKDEPDQDRGLQRLELGLLLHPGLHGKGRKHGRPG